MLLALLYGAGVTAVQNSGTILATIMLLNAGKALQEFSKD